jgi:hypothetical protein
MDLLLHPKKPRKLEFQGDRENIHLKNKEENIHPKRRIPLLKRRKEDQ